MRKIEPVLVTHWNLSSIFKRFELPYTPRPRVSSYLVSVQGFGWIQHSMPINIQVFVNPNSLKKTNLNISF